MLKLLPRFSRIYESKLYFLEVSRMDLNSKSMSVDIGGMRVAYKDQSETFVETNLAHKEPIGQFRSWFEEACNTRGILEANAMCLATATKDGIPSARYVLLKGYGTEGFKFYTNYSSRKGRELLENPLAALTFYWDKLKRQVRVEGIVQRLEESESDEYFHSRPFDSRIGACASEQSTVIASRDMLSMKTKQLVETYGNRQEALQRPTCWGGFLVIPSVVEFWQGQSDRLHDRIRFRKHSPDKSGDGNNCHKGDDGWVYERLSP